MPKGLANKLALTCGKNLTQFQKALLGFALKNTRKRRLFGWKIHQFPQRFLKWSPWMER